MTVPWRALQQADNPSAGTFAGFLMGSFKELDERLKRALPGVGMALTPEKPFTNMPPPNASHDELARAVNLVGGGLGPLILAGFSAGCGTVRNYLLSGEAPDVVVTLDGTTGNWPTLQPRQLEVWRELAVQARAGECCWVATCTQQSYTEQLKATPARPKDFPFWWTRHLLEEACGVALPPGSEVHDGGLHLLSYPSARIDGAAHVGQLQHAFPDVLARFVAPWLAGLPPLDVAPEEVTNGPTATSEPVGWGEAVLDAAAFFLNLGIIEQGHNAGSRLEEFFLKPLHLPAGSSYCAAFVAACIRQAAGRLGRNPVTSGSPGAKATSEPFKPLGLYVPQGAAYDGRAIAEAIKPGSLLIMDRSKKGPGEAGFEGHIGVVIERVGERSAGLIEGNADRVLDPAGHIYAVCQAERRLDDPDVLGLCLWPS
jgi:hypothetical protein